jgi:hypothetical protein
MFDKELFGLLDYIQFMFEYVNISEHELLRFDIKVSDYLACPCLATASAAFLTASVSPR